MSGFQLTSEIREILERGRCDGYSYFLPAGKLERKTYEAVNKILTNAGGKWDRKTQSHLFNCDPAESLGITLQTGVSRNRDRDIRKMKPEGFHRLHSLRMENDAAGFAMREAAPRFATMAGRHENGTAPRAVVAYQLFQTPAELAKRMAALLNPKPGARILEPSAGLGRLLDALAPFNPGEIVAVEQSPQCAGELFAQNREGVTIKQRDFLSVTTADIGDFDCVLMNPPFHLRSDIKHIEHARTFLRPGGKLVAICLDGYKRAEILRPIADSWEVLPAGTFKEAGTNITAVLLTIKQ